MSDHILVIVDAASIQPYVFGSNRLRENVGASHLVHLATDVWARTARGQSGELVYAGGGNFVAKFPSGDEAKNFSRTLSERVLIEAPGLQILIHHEPWGNSLRETVAKGFAELNKYSRARTVHHPLLGLGITAVCQSTGLPAVGMTEGIVDEDTGNVDQMSIYPASSQVLAKWAVVKEANERLASIHALPDGMEYPLDFDDLGGSKGEDSHIAVVHADGDGLGLLFSKLAKDSNLSDEDYLTQVKGLSGIVQKSATAALHHILQAVPISNANDNRYYLPSPTGESIYLPTRKRRNGSEVALFPVRPLVFGGDDLTFVCDGRLGLALATAYLSKFEQETANSLVELNPPLKDNPRKLTACAGVAIVKSHYPFARAYELAEQLCSNAKRYRREHNLDSCLDWHFALSGLSGDIEDIRRREYTSDHGKSLVLRPVTVADNSHEQWRTWQTVHKAILAFATPGPDDSKSHDHTALAMQRNKIKALRDSLRQGPTAVEHFLVKFNKGQPLPDLGIGEEWRKTGWIKEQASDKKPESRSDTKKERCGYFDALELVDHFIPLNEAGI